MRNVIALIVLVMQLAACGYKGALYLPPETPAVGGPAPEPAREDENKKPASQ
jgi:predicted small lipoprotein YifL